VAHGARAADPEIIAAPGVRAELTAWS
jgi:hypothetical protein